MDHLQDHGNKASSDDESLDLRRGPWTVDEDFTLINYIAHHGEGRWNSLARCAGLKRTGKSCRLRWLNYLRPDVRRGNITLEEQLLILELHSRWGNRWSKIAQHLPGRTDNEIKNYWRTRVQKHAKQLKCDVNSKQFKDTMRYLWMPRLVERIQAAAGGGSSSSHTDETATALASMYPHNNSNNNNNNCSSTSTTANLDMGSAHVALLQGQRQGAHTYTPDNSSAAASSDSFGTPECYNNIQDYYPVGNTDNNNNNNHQFGYGDQTLTSPTGLYNQGLEFNGPWMDGGDALWNADDVWFLQQQFMNGNA